MKPLIGWDDPVAYPLKEEIEYIDGLKKFQDYIDHLNIPFLVLVKFADSLESPSIPEKTKPVNLFKNKVYKNGGNMKNKKWYGLLLLIILLTATWKLALYVSCKCVKVEDNKVLADLPKPTPVPTQAPKAVSPDPMPEAKAKTAKKEVVHEASGMKRGIRVINKSHKMLSVVSVYPDPNNHGKFLRKEVQKSSKAEINFPTVYSKLNLRFFHNGKEVKKAIHEFEPGVDRVYEEVIN